MRREEGELLGWSPDIMLEAKLDEATFSDAEKRQRLIQELASEPDETIDEVRKILRTNAKRWWKVAVQVIRVIGYPCNVVAMSELIEQISDKNSPAWESVICTCLALIICAGCGMFSPGGSAGLLTDFASAMSQFDGHNWSPDGHWLAAESSNIDNFALFSADGHLVNSLDLGCYLGSGVEDIAWLPDGRLSCVVEKRPPMLGIFTLNRSGQVGKKTMIPVPIEPQVVVSAIQWNPHESWLATIAASQVGSIHIPTLYISDLKGHLLFGPMLIEANTLAWSHDGKTLALVLNDNTNGNGDIKLLHLQPMPTGALTVTNTQQLVAGTASGENVEWSSSDRWLVCHYGSYESEDYLFLLAADGSGKRVKLTSSKTDGQLGYPSWSPDGKQLIVTRASDGALLSLDITALLKEKRVEP